MGITPTEYSLNKDRILNFAAATTGLNHAGNLTQENFICIDPKTTRLWEKPNHLNIAPYNYY